MEPRVRRPLSFVAAGLVLVALDFRTDLPDLLPDPLGWALVAVGAWSLALRPAAALAAVAAVASVAETALPYRYVYINPDTGEVADDAVGELYGFSVDQRWPDVSDGRALAIGAAYAAGGLALWLVLRALGRRASATGDGAAAGRLRLLRAVVPAVWSLPVLAVIGVAVAPPRAVPAVAAGQRASRLLTTCVRVGRGRVVSPWSDSCRRNYRTKVKRVAVCRGGPVTFWGWPTRFGPSRRVRV